MPNHWSPRAWHSLCSTISPPNSLHLSRSGCTPLSSAWWSGWGARKIATCWSPQFQELPPRSDSTLRHLTQLLQLYFKACLTQSPPFSCGPQRSCLPGAIVWGPWRLDGMHRRASNPRRSKRIWSAWPELKVGSVSAKGVQYFNFWLPSSAIILLSQFWATLIFGKSIPKCPLSSPCRTSRDTSIGVITATYSLMKIQSS